MSFQWVGSSRISTQQWVWETTLSETGLCFSNWIEVYWLKKKTRLSSLLQHPQRCWGGLLRRTVRLVGTPANISVMWYSPTLHEKMDFHRCQRLGKTVVNVTLAEICTHLCLSKYYLRARFAHLVNARKCHICVWFRLLCKSEVQP